jgi:autotransporter-associated beta strand protein
LTTKPTFALVTTSTLTVNNSTTIANPITGGFGITKAGSGTLTLSATNNYTGATVVSGGTLVVSGSLSGSAVTVATLSGSATLAGTGLITQNVNIGNGSGAPDSAVIDPGTLVGTGTLTLSGTLTIGTDGAYDFTLNSTSGSTSASEIIAKSISLTGNAQFNYTDLAGLAGTTLAPSTAYTVLSTTGTLTGQFANLAPGQDITINDTTFAAAYTSNSLTLTAVPEPGTWALMLAGLGILAFWQRNRRYQH